MTEEQKYTLEEAEKILKRRECDYDGHDLNQTLHIVDFARVYAIDVHCLRCGARFEEKI